MERKVKLYLAKAEAFLEEAAAARKHGLDRSLAHNIYYAAYHAASALLAHLGHEYKKHRETLSAFRNVVVKAGLMTSDHNRTLSRAQTIRDETDYNLEAIPNPKKLREVHDQVVEFVGEIKRVLQATPAQPEVPQQGKFLD